MREDLQDKNRFIPGIVKNQDIRRLHTFITSSARALRSRRTIQVPFPKNELVLGIVNETLINTSEGICILRKNPEDKRSDINSVYFKTHVRDVFVEVLRPDDDSSVNKNLVNRIPRECEDFFNRPDWALTG